MKLDPATIITAIAGLVTALASAGVFERRRRRRKRQRESEHAARIASVGSPPSRNEAHDRDRERKP